MNWSKKVDHVESYITPPVSLKSNKQGKWTKNIIFYSFSNIVSANDMASKVINNVLRHQTTSDFKELSDIWAKQIDKGVKKLPKFHWEEKS